MDNNQLSLDLIKQLKNRILRSRYIVAKVIDEISERLQKELPGIRGFSSKNIAK
jgi:hypothetical protein